MIRFGGVFKAGPDVLDLVARVTLKRKMETSP